MRTEIPRFLIVGAVATAVSFLGFNAAVHGWIVGTAPLREHPLTGYILANAVAGAVAYVGMRTWAFGERDVHRPVRSIALFYGIGALTLTVPVLFLAFSRHVLGLDSAWADNISANVLGLGASTALRFLLFRRHVFVAPGLGQG